MKKQILFALALFFGLLGSVFLSPTSTLAECTPYSGITCTSQQGQTYCPTSSGKFCCGSVAECNVLNNLPSQVGNSCYFNAGQGCDLNHRTGCVAGGQGYCCDSQTSCDKFKTTSNFSSSGNLDPTAQCGGTGINTAVGCIPFDKADSFVGTLFKWALGIGGGIAFLLIVYSGFLIMTSSGNPERLKAGQELMTSAISGLVLLISSVFVLKFIGIDILGLGAFGFGK